VSTTVTLKEADPVFPCESVARHVTVVLPSGNVEPGCGEQMTSAIGPSESSIASGVGNVTTEPAALFASTRRSGETPLSAGGLRSTYTTVTLKLPVATLPWASLAEHVTVVMPIANVDPEDGLQLAATAPSTLSKARAENVTGVPPSSDVSTVWFGGRERAGLVVSTTETVKRAGGETLPEESVAVQLTVVVPTGNVLPEA
jgi:hypothetical protein